MDPKNIEMLEFFWHLLLKFLDPLSLIRFGGVCKFFSKICKPHFANIQRGPVETISTRETDDYCRCKVTTIHLLYDDRSSVIYYGDRSSVIYLRHTVIVLYAGKFLDLADMAMRVRQLEKLNLQYTIKYIDLVNDIYIKCVKTHWCLFIGKQERRFNYDMQRLTQNNNLLLPTCNKVSNRHRSKKTPRCECLFCVCDRLKIDREKLCSAVKEERID
jgi:hypothetical protein